MKTTLDYVRRGREMPGEFKRLADREPENPCKEHPHWEAEECNHCRKDGTGCFGDIRRLHPEERKRLKVQTGRDFFDRAEFEAWKRLTGKRSMEAGEAQSELRRDFNEWERSGRSGPAPDEGQHKGFGRVKRDFDVKKYLDMIEGA